MLWKWFGRVLNERVCWKHIRLGLTQYPYLMSIVIFGMLRSFWDAKGSHPVYSLQRKSHRFCPDAPEPGLIFDQDPLRLAGAFRGIVPGTMPLNTSDFRQNLPSDIFRGIVPGTKSSGASPHRRFLASGALYPVQKVQGHLLNDGF